MIVMIVIMMMMIMIVMEDDDDDDCDDDDDDDDCIYIFGYIGLNFMMRTTSENKDTAISCCSCYDHV